MPRTSFPAACSVALSDHSWERGSPCAEWRAPTPACRIRLSHARHHIDMLGVLEEKTQGNLAADEKALLAHVLTDLRMTYVAVEGRAKHAKS